MIAELGLKSRSVVVELSDGETRKMDFDMGALANAEGAYEERFGKSMANVNQIIGELAMGKTRAVMAFAYGAMLSAGEKMTWEQFTKSVFTFENYQKLTDTVADAVAAMMQSGDDGVEEHRKNACSRGEN